MHGAWCVASKPASKDFEAFQRELIMKSNYRRMTALGLLAILGAQARAQDASEYVPQTPSVTRTIYIGPATTHVNVTQDDVVRFISREREFTFSFHSDHLRSFNLQHVAPPGMLEHPVTAYVARGSGLSGGSGSDGS
jgi:hypothetical protein